MNLLRDFLAGALVLAFTPITFAQSGATAAETLKVLPGFKVELLKSAGAREGSWVSMAIDAKGRLYVSPQGKAPDGDLLRLTLDAAGQVAKTDWINLKVGAAMGMLWAFDSLYVSGEGPDGQGIYRLRDSDGDDQLDEVRLFKKVPGGGGEHGAHALVLGPDGKSIYIAHGNSTPPVDGIADGSPYQHWQEDTLLPRILDPVATFFDKLKVPYGQIYRTDENGTRWELIAGGFRNHYDIDFNSDGELFTYDSDMEWDVNLPWYRPTRILHIVSGADFGFREGNTKWPVWYPDTCAPVVNVGLGCPTGVKFGTRSNFPARYKSAFFAMDWTFGRILAIHMRPQGASYTADNPLPSLYDLRGPNESADVESFVSGKGLPVTDLEFGKDGAMYFTVGGRGTQGGLYRVSYAGPAENAPQAQDATAADARNTRKMLEGFHGKDVESGVIAAWSYLGDNDRAIRYAARVALESQAVDKWRGRALAETEPKAGLTALLALARVGSQADQEPLLKALAKWPLDSLDEEWKLNKLRVVELSFIRQGRPGDELMKLATEKLSKQYPAKTYALNHELSELLIWLDAPDAVEKTLAVLQNTTAPAEQVWFANVLGAAKSMTREQRAQFFAWFSKAREFKGGNSFAKFLGRIKEEGLAKVPVEARGELGSILDPMPPPLPKATVAVPPRAFQKAWTMADLTGELDAVGKGRNFARGKEVFASTQCLQCHRFGRDGGNVGPDLSAVANRFNRHDLLETIIDPSKAISEQYASYVITTKKGETLMGQIVEENNDHLTLVTDPLAGTRQNVSPSQVASRDISKVSLMPPGLLNVLTKDEIFDLLAYLESGGNESAPLFRK
jgi:putative heme-binding domain-containing protein